MKIVRTIDEVRAAKLQGGSLVPTMGALHSGHLQLVKQAKKFGGPVVVSIFVNPTQFGANEDFDKYPRDLEKDLAKLAAHEVDWVFAPSANEMYRRQTTTVTVAEVTRYYEGAIRPGHFDGVATIVCKLMNICRPSTALFGLKDLQQCAVIKRMVADLDLPLTLHFEETIRENDGLAMSSRNIYLSELQRINAPELYRQLQTSANSIRQGKPVEETLLKSQSALKELGFGIDYFDLIEVDTFSKADMFSDSTAIIAAVKVGTTRLIDNILLSITKNMS